MYERELSGEQSMTDELSVAIEHPVASLPAPGEAETLHVAGITTARRRPGWIVPLALVAAASLPIWLVPPAAAGLYERDSSRINHTTIDELPDLLQIGGLGSTG